jgi:DNA polymerase III subunit beta
MQVRVATEKIRNAINKILSVVDKKNSRPILTYTLISAEKGMLEFSATDLEVSSKVKLKANITEEGSFCVNAKNLSDILRELPNNELELVIDDSENVLKINCGDIHFTLLIYRNDDFPKLSFVNDKNEFEIPARKILDIINKTSYAISNDETRLYLSGLFLQEVDSKLRAVATDGHRLSLLDTEMKDLDRESQVENLVNGIIIPRKGVFELKKIAENYVDNSLKLSVDDSFIYVNANDEYFLSIRLIAREYPKYQAVIPAKTSFTLTADRNSFFDAVRRIKIMSNEKSNGVRVKVGERELLIMANHPSLGDARETIPVDYNGKEMEIGFNAKYLIDTLSTIQEGEISFELNNELSPIVIKSGAEPNYLGIIMPLKL